MAHCRLPLSLIFHFIFWDKKQTWAASPRESNLFVEFEVMHFYDFVPVDAVASVDVVASVVVDVEDGVACGVGVQRDAVSVQFACVGTGVVGTIDVDVVCGGLGVDAAARLGVALLLMSVRSVI